MDRFKTKPGINESILISEANFSGATGKLEPYYEAKSALCKAVCPLCDNPIEIIGLYRKHASQNSKKPYGRHHKGTVEKLAMYDEEAYLHCPYSDPTRRLREKRRLHAPLSDALCSYMIENFDHIIGVLEHSIGVHISRAFADDLLSLYIGDEGWRYYDSTYQNLPFMLMYARPADKLFGRLVYRDSPIAKALEEKCSSVSLQEYGKYLKIASNGTGFVRLTFYICNHKFTPRGESIDETYRLVVNDDKTEILSHIIHVDPNAVSDAVQNNLYADSEIRNLTESAGLNNSDGVSEIRFI